MRKKYNNTTEPLSTYSSFLCFHKENKTRGICTVNSVRKAKLLIQFVLELLQLLTKV